MDASSLGMRLAKDEPFAYNILILVFRYLGLKDLLRCARVCKLWKWIAYDTSLWQSMVVQCCAGHISDAAKIYEKTRNLELLKLESMRLPLDNLKKILLKTTNLRRIKLYGCSPEQFQLLAEHCKNLERMCVEIISDPCRPPIDLNFMATFQNLTHLELMSYRHVEEVQTLQKLTKLKHLAFNARCDESCWKDVAEIETLETLCLNNDVVAETGWENELFKSNFYLRELKNLKRLQLDSVNCLHELDILEKIKDLPNLKELVLLNVTISSNDSSTFGRLLGNCHNIEKLTLLLDRDIVLPCHISIVALENSEVINGVAALKDTLKHFHWIMDTPGLNFVKDAYHLEKATVIKDDSRAEGDGMVPITTMEMSRMLKEMLPDTKVHLEVPQGGSVVKAQCFACNEKVLERIIWP